MRFKIILFQFILCFVFTVAKATNYYVSVQGNDHNPGTSPALAWRTTARVNATTFQPGDQVLLEGGQSFWGNIWLRSSSQGTASQPITFRSYGGGQAVIQSDSTFGFYAHNTAGIAIRNLAFVGSGRLSNQNSGIIFYLDSANAHLQYLRIDSVDVSGYRSSGLSIGSWNGLSGYANVRVTNSDFHANGEVGFNSYAYFPAPQGYAHHNWYVGNCRAYDNSGRADITSIHTGNGIMLSGIDQALMEQCTAYHNGWLNGSTAGGPVGIWGWGCNALTIQKSESHHNMSGTNKDGGGFDLDGGCTNSVLQYNYSHDNEGPGYLLAQFPGASAMHNLTVRYNISENDARRNNYGAITLWSSGSSGGIEHVDIYNNTVVVSRPNDNSSPHALYIMSGAITDISLRNNVLQTSAGLLAAVSATNVGVRLEGNCYWAPAAAISLYWDGTTYTSLAAWRAATTQETLLTSGQVTGICANPCFAPPAAGSSSSIPLSSPVPAYNLASVSPLLGAGLNLQASFGIAPGSRDFFGNATPPNGIAGNVGASEARVAALPTRSVGSSAPWCEVYPTVIHHEIHLVAVQAATQPIEVQLYDMMGRSCRSWRTAGSQLMPGGLTLAVSGLAAGQYVLSVQSGTQRLRQSVVVAAD
jgi:hypothetical protein